MRDRRALAGGRGRDREPWPLRLERAYLPVAFGVLASMAALVGGQPDDADSLNPLAEVAHETAQGDTLKQALLLTLYAVSFALLLTRSKRRLLPFVGPPLLCLLAWTFLSVGWSGEPNITIRRCIAIAGTAALGVHLATRFDTTRMLRTLSTTFFVLLCLSALLAVAIPSRGLDIEGRLRGVFDHKNGMGAAAAVSALLFFSRALLLPRTRLAILYCGGAVALSLALLGWAHSAGPIPAFGFGCGCVVVGALLHRVNGGLAAATPAVLALAVVGAIFAVATLAGGEGAAALGRDSDLSGRTLVWAFTLKMIGQQPFLGYGYQTFWEAANPSSSAQVFWSIQKIAVRHSHDGYLQLTLDLGVVGLACMLATVGLLVGRLTRLLHSARRPAAAWVAGYLGLLLLLNVGETRLWAVNDLLVVLFVYAVTRVNIEYRLAFPASGRVSRVRGSVPATLQVSLGNV